MRKTQENLIRRAEKENLPQASMDFLMSESYPIWYLKEVYNLLSYWHMLELNIGIIEKDISVIEKVMEMAVLYANMHGYSIKTVIHNVIKWAGLDYYTTMDFFCNSRFTEEEKIYRMELLEHGAPYSEIETIYLEYLQFHKKIGGEEWRTYLTTLLAWKLLPDEKKPTLQVAKEYASFFAGIPSLLYRKKIDEIQCYLKHQIPKEEILDNAGDIHKLIEQRFLRYFPKLKQYMEQKAKSKSHEYEDLHEYEDRNALQALLQVIDGIQNDELFLEINLSVSEFSLKKSLMAVNLTFRRYNKTYLMKNLEGNVSYGPSNSNLQKSTELVIFYGGDSPNKSAKYYEKKNGRLIPLTFKNIIEYKKAYGKLFDNIIGRILEDESADGSYSYVMRDLRKYMESGDMLVPITVNECVNIRNLNQLLRGKYKDGSLVNWNRIDINLGYAILKAIPYVGEKDRQRLLQERDASLVKNISGPAKKVAPAFLENIIKRALGENSLDSSLIHDYIRMSIELHEPVRIGFKSLKKLRKAHDQAMVKINNRGRRIVKTSSKSKFYPLYRKLPKDFEWIRTAKRLKAEGIVMHHCVYSYAEKITKDQCAIFSLLYGEEKTRYTIEFIVNNSQYCIRQIQAEWNSGCPEEVRKYVTEKIKEIKPAI